MNELNRSPSVAPAETRPCHPSALLAAGAASAALSRGKCVFIVFFFDLGLLGYQVE